MSALQTLDRGVRVLELVSLRPRGITVAELAKELDAHRAICYRIVTTLEEHALVTRLPDGRIRLGPGLAVLASRFAPQFQDEAGPVLDALASRTGATAFLSMAHGDDCVVTMVASPPGSAIHVGYRVGLRHPLNRGAAGIAILALRPASPRDAAAVQQARREGVIVTRGELERGAVGIAAGVVLPPEVARSTGIECSVGVVAIDGLDTDMAAEPVRSAARQLAEILGATDAA